MQRIDGWITAQQAGRILGVRPQRIYRLVRRGRLRRRPSVCAEERRYYVSLVEVHAFAANPERIRRNQGRLRRGRQIGSAPPTNARLLTCREAAAELGVSLSCVYFLIAHGRLETYRQPGVRRRLQYVVTLSSVEAYREDPMRQKLRRLWEDGHWYAEPKSEVPEETEAEEEEGEWLTAAQAGRRLGVSVGVVYKLRQRGRLRGWRLRSGSGKRGWHFRREEVEALQADAQYAAYHRRWKEAHTEEKCAQRAEARLTEALDRTLRVHGWCDPPSAADYYEWQVW